MKEHDGENHCEGNNKRGKYDFPHFSELVELFRHLVERLDKTNSVNYSFEIVTTTISLFWLMQRGT